MEALRRWRGEATDRGASAVEFALVTPALLLILFGIINFSFIFSQQLSLNNAVRQGARAAVVIGSPGQTTCKNVVDGVRSASNAIGLDKSLIQVVVQTQNASGTLLPAGQQPCGSSPNPAGSVVVCQNSLQSGASNSIVVTATYQAPNTVLPWPPVPGQLANVINPKLSAKAVYRCEFS